MPLSDYGSPPPPGKLRQTITYLEMTAPPPGDRGAPADPRLEPPARLSPKAYRALYRAVGEPWLWWERLVLGESELAAIVDDGRVEVRLLCVDGEIAGFSGIDRRGDDGAVEIAFLGLKPAFTGGGLGRILLAATLRAAWTETGTGAVRRVWLHTCDHDYPGRLASTGAPASTSAAARRR